MKFKSNALLILVLILLAQTVYGQDCSDLLQQGIRESVKEYTYSQNFTQVQTSVCETYNEYKKSGNLVKANASYKVIFKGNANYSKEQIESIGRTYCELSSTEVRGLDVNQIDRTYIDPNFSEMYKACISAKSQNVKLELKPTDAINQSISVTASYSSSGGERPKVTGIIYDEERLVVKGPLLEAATNRRALEGFLTLTAVRKDIKNESFQVGNEKLLANSHQMVIQFENGAITINFPKILPTPPKIELTKGVGEIIASMMPLDKFREIYGADWALADGSPAPSDSKYRKYIGERLPDLRGVFLRGKNYDRDASTGNPDGDINIGEYQKDDVLEHKHNLTQFGIGGGETNAISDNVRQNYPPKPVGKSTDTYGGKETRPRNVTVNYYIRIN